MVGEWDTLKDTIEVFGKYEGKGMPLTCRSMGQI